MSHTAPPPVRRAGPFELSEPIPLPGSGPWFCAQRVVYSRGINDALVCVAPDHDTRDALRSAHEALTSVEDARLPSPIGWYEGVGALAVAAQPGRALTDLHAADLDRATLLDIALEICEVLANLHDSGVVHGAVLPDNVTLGSEGHIVLWRLGEGATPPSDWQPPDRGPASMASEQWSFGALLAHLVTGQGPRADPPLPAEWPGLSRLIARMMSRSPADRYPSMNGVKRELLRLSRRAASPSRRRELGALFHSVPSPPSSRSSMAKPPRIQIPMPTTKTPATDIHEAPTARPMEPRRHRPHESVPVVRPNVGDYVPTASVRTPSSFADIEINPSVVDNDIAVVPVEFDDTDHGRPQPIGISMPTDDMPVPTPDDVFGALEVADGDPLDAPIATQAMTPRPLNNRPSGPTAVPTTESGFGTVSLDLDGDEDSFFSDAAAGVQGIDNLPMNPRRDGPREPSMVERVAHGMVIANAALFALWFVVRVF